MTVRKETRGGEPRLVIDILYKTADGKRRRYRRDAQVQTATAARAEERRLLTELATKGEIVVVAPPPEPATPTITTTFAQAAEYFRRTKALSALKPSTRSSYGEVLKRVLEPRFGKTALADISLANVVELDADLVGDGLSPTSRRNVHVVLRSVLRAAKDAGLVARLPELPKLPKVGRKILRPLERRDIDAILVVSSESARRAFALAAFAGLRAGEVRGLTWGDVDLREKVLVVRRAISRGIAAAPKSGHERQVPLARRLLELLKTAAPKQRTAVAIVAPTKAGKVWGEWGLRLAFMRAQKRAKLSGFRFHDLRHFFVTELFRNGAPAPAVQMLAGHADLTTTQRYAHMVTNDLRATIACLDRGNGVETGPSTTKATGPRRVG
jgi:integrase